MDDDTTKRRYRVRGRFSYWARIRDGAHVDREVEAEDEETAKEVALELEMKAAARLYDSVDDYEGDWIEFPGSPQVEDLGPVEPVRVENTLRALDVATLPGFEKLVYGVEREEDSATGTD